MSKADAKLLRQAIAPRASEFVDAHVVMGLHALSGDVIYYADGKRKHTELLEDAILVAAADIRRKRAEKKRRAKLL